MQPEGIEFLTNRYGKIIIHKHPAIYTCEEAREHCSHIPVLHCKNLFLKQKENNNYFMVILPADKRMNLKHFATVTSSKKILFANEHDLYSILKLEPGSVSPFGLINDLKNQVTLYIDQSIWDAKVISFHPNINDETLELQQEMFHECIQYFNNKYFVIPC